MKKIKLVTVILLAGNLFLFFLPAKAQTTTTTTTGTAAFSELVIGVPKISDKTLYTFKETINSTEGAEYVMFCPEQRLILIKYNSNIFPKKEDLVTALKSKCPSTTIDMKQQNFGEVKELCAQ
jgi:hypothetical protein